MSDYQKELENRVEELQNLLARTTASLVVTVSRHVTKKSGVVDTIKIYAGYKGIEDPNAGWVISAMTGDGVGQIVAIITFSDALYYAKTRHGVDVLDAKEDEVINFTIDKLGLSGADRIDEPIKSTVKDSIGDMIQYEKVLKEAAKHWVNVNQYGGNGVSVGTVGPAVPVPPSPQANPQKTFDPGMNPWMVIQADPNPPSDIKTDNRNTSYEKGE